ncbi:hypothetical protein [Arenivirga flava]|uniref:hypothetical protein n=1 Tax=Arenivirga flava TaxID=1930060 RepID=UPI0024E05EB7|nr:hypothetical protein [Arenivirga flava]
MDTELSLEEAKQGAIDLASELATFIPASAVGEIERPPDGILMNCGDDGYQWTGRTVVPLLEPIDTDALVVSIIEHFEDSVDHEAISIPTADGEPRVQVRGRFGASAIVAEHPDEPEIRISSLSSCFVLPEGVSPLGRH